MHIVETRSRRQRERERDSLTRTTHPSGYISSRGSRRGRIKKKKKKKKGRVEYSEPIAWKSFAEYSSCETGDNYLISAVANNETTTTTTAKSFCPRSDAIFSAVSSSPSLFLSLSFPVGSKERGGRKGEEETLSLFRSVNANERYIWKAGKTCQRAVFIRWNASSPPKTVYTLMHLHPVARLNSF